MKGFEFAGVTSFQADDGEEARRVLKKLVDEGRFNLIILPERFAKATSEIRMLVLHRGKISPVFAVVPDLTGIKGERLEELRSLISLAVGAKLKLE